MNRNLLPTFCLAYAMGSTASLAAEPQKLTSQMLNEMVAGSVISLDTPIGSKVPMRFGRDGIVTGEAGILAAYLGSAKDRGRWWVAKDQLCIKWFRWFESQPRCMEIRADGTRILWRRDDGDSGTATLTERGAPAVAAAKPQPPEKALTAGEKPKPAAQTEVPKPSPEPPVAIADADAAAAPEDANASAGAEKPLPPAALGGPLEAEKAEGQPKPEPAEAEKPAADLSTLEAAAPAETVAPPQAERSEVAEAPVASAPPAKMPEVGGPADRATASRADGIADTAQTKPKAKPPIQQGKAASPAPAGASKKLAQAEAAKPGPSFRVAKVGEDDMLNVRRGPAESHPVVGVISPQGRGVRIVGACVADWCPIRHAGLSGWVNRYYLAVE